MKKTKSTLPCRLTISRLMGGGPDVMRLAVTDEASGVAFLKISISPGDLMLSMTGRSVVTEMEIRGAELIGAKSEHKTEVVPFTDRTLRCSDERKGLDDHERSPMVEKAFAPFEVDGWRGSSSDLFNGHRSTKGGQNVSFHRYIHPKTGKPIEAQLAAGIDPYAEADFEREIIALREDKARLDWLEKHPYVPTASSPFTGNCHVTREAIDSVRLNVPEGSIPPNLPVS